MVRIVLLVDKGNLIRSEMIRMEERKETAVARACLLPCEANFLLLKDIEE